MQWIALSVEGDERNHDHNVTSLSHGSAINDGIIIIDAIESAVQLSNADMTDTEDLAKKEGIVESFQNHVTSHASSSFNALLTVRLNDVNVDVPEDFKPEHLLAILQVIRRC
jgi:predicted phosphatase